MMHVLLLLSKKVSTHAVERVAAELVVALQRLSENQMFIVRILTDVLDNYLKHIKDNTALSVDSLVLARTKCLGLELGVAHLALDVPIKSKSIIACDFTESKSNMSRPKYGKRLTRRAFARSIK